MTTVQAIEYLKQEELGNKAFLQQKIKVVENAVNDAEFWREVQRIRSGGGWRVEEERISLEDIELSPEEKAELDKQARELLAAKKELLEKKRMEEKKRNEDEAIIRKLLLEEAIFAKKMRVSQNEYDTPYPNNSYGTSYYVKWNPNSISIADMYSSYKELKQYRDEIKDKVKTHVFKFMEVYWNKSDEETLNTPLNRIYWPDQAISHISSCLIPSEELPNDKEWKGLIISEIGSPYLQEEFKKYLYFCEKFIERNKGKLRLHEVLQKNEELENKIKTLTNRNEVLEKKFISISTLIHN